MSLSLLGPAAWLGYDRLMGILEAQECELKHARESCLGLALVHCHFYPHVIDQSKSHGQSQITWPVPSHRANPRHMANPKANGKGVDAERSEEV